jgi:hypothetical protein
MEDLLIGFLMVGCVLAGIAAISWHRKKKINAFARNMKLKSIARKKGFDFVGKINNRQVEIEDQKFGRHFIPYTIVKVSLKNPGKHYFTIFPRAEDLANPMKNLIIREPKDYLKENDSIIKNELFHENFYVKSNCEDFVQSLIAEKTTRQMLKLKRTRPQTLTDFFSGAPYFHLLLGNDKIYFIKKGLSLDCDFYQETLKFMFSFADLIEAKSG